jgi:hypothetical protein
MAKKDVVEEVAVEEEVVVETTVKDHRMKLVHPDGRVAFAPESMVNAYKSAGFKEEQ